MNDIFFYHFSAFVFFLVPLIWPVKKIVSSVMNCGERVREWENKRKRKRNVIFHRSIRHPLKMRNNFWFIHWGFERLKCWFWDFKVEKKEEKKIYIWNNSTKYLQHSLVNDKYKECEFVVLWRLVIAQVTENHTH